MITKVGAVGGGQIICPSDRELIPVFGADRGSLPKNWQLLAQVQAAAAAVPAKGAQRCELCEQQHAASHRCVDCQQ
jgi:hypothetical protein